jgi:hypothetical protein
MKVNKLPAYFFLLLLSALLIVNCAARHFRTVADSPPSVKHTLQNWPFSAYWTGIVFNGAKIGFTHFSLQPAADAPGQYDVRSEAYFKFRLLMFNKSIKLTARDRISSDLTLVSFYYDYNLDGNRQEMIGQQRADRLEYTLITQGDRQQISLPVSKPLYPVGCVLMVPVLQGLEVGRKYRYQVFDGETRTIQTVEQSIEAYEESDLFDGRGFKMKTRMQGQEVTTWLDEKGRPLLEMSLSGVIISALENQFTAERYLSQAALNKEDIFIDFSLIPSNRVLKEPEKINAMTVILTSRTTDIQIPSDRRQQCIASNPGVTCTIRLKPVPAQSASAAPSPGTARKYLLPSNSIPAGHTAIKTLADKIIVSRQADEDKIQALIQWMKENIQQEPVDVFSALDVLNGKKAECQGYALLFTALARSAGIPTRVVNGIVYSPDFNGFLYHAWTESMVDGHWVAVDPTFRQYPADATHIKFIEGENPSDLLPLIGLIGKIDINIISTEP